MAAAKTVRYAVLCAVCCITAHPCLQPLHAAAPVEKPGQLLIILSRKPAQGVGLAQAGVNC